MKQLRQILTVGVLMFAFVTVSYGGTITGSRTGATSSRVGTITGSRTGTITGSRVGTITGSRTGTITGSGSRSNQGGEPPASPLSTFEGEFLLQLMTIFLSTGW